MISSPRTAYGKAAVLGSIALTAAFIALTAWSADRIPFPKPDSHRGDWARNHGLHAQVDINEAGQTGGTCVTCHEKNDCVSCHAQTMPRDHTGLWRTRGHGLTASVNRERCLYCHRQDYCVRCHNETAPRSHTAGWVTRHCQWCHLEGTRPGGGCGVCHKRSPH